MMDMEKVRLEEIQTIKQVGDLSALGGKRLYRIISCRQRAAPALHGHSITRDRRKGRGSEYENTHGEP
jgi:hypothetical protein